MGLRRDIRQRYNIEGSGGSDLYVLTSQYLFISISHRVFSPTAGARGAAFLALSHKSPVKSRSRSKASLEATRRKGVRHECSPDRPVI